MATFTEWLRSKAEPSAAQIQQDAPKEEKKVEKKEEKKEVSFCLSRKNSMMLSFHHLMRQRRLF